jgi:hypothetical protein
LAEVYLRFAKPILMLMTRGRYANYVNEVIHNCVVKYAGSPNKNMGGAILCVWRSNGDAATAAEGALQAMEEAITTVNDHAELTSLIENCAELQKRRPGFKVSQT